MKDTLININLETSTSPVIAETRGRDWIEYGDANGDWRNLYPQFLIDLYYSSSISAAIINATSEMIAGEALVIEDEEERDLEARVKLQHFLDRANSNESLHEVIKKLSFDFKLQGAFALNIVYARDRSQGISEIYHIASEKIRCAKPDEFGKVNGYYISSDWSNTRTNKPYYVPAFNPNDRTSANQIMYSGLYSPNMNCYYTPDYVSCNNWALIDSKVSEYHLNNITNSFSGSYLFSFNNGTPTSEERRKIEQSIKDKFTSEKAAGRFVLCFSDDRNRAPEITPLNTADLSEQYLALQELLTANICSGHRVTSKTLVGIDSKNGFSSNTDELINASDFYNQTVIRPFQDQLIKQLRKIFQVNQMDMPVRFVQLKPITVQFDSKTIREVMTTDEIREELGLEPLHNEEETVEETVDFSNVEKTELDSWIEEFGEDIPEDWELLDEENVEGEHEDFDFEAELNKLVEDKLELASTGTARPNARSVQDGVNDSYNDYYKVRYFYTKDTALSQEGETREFCKLMMRAKKIYRKEDILQLTDKPVNRGWGPKGNSATYSIWLDKCSNSLNNNKLELYKGGGNCHHFWERKIYKTSLRNAKADINSRQIISDAKAISEGFTLKRNSALVAKAPKTMKNNGFLNPR